MIGKILKNNSFRATTRYVLGKEEAQLLDGGTIVEHTTDDIAREFRLSRDLNPEIERPVYHLVQSYSYDDRDYQNLDDDNLCDLAVRHFAGLVVLAHEPQLIKPMKAAQESKREQGKATYRSRVEEFLENGLFEYQFFVAKHQDTAHTHTHMVASRINLVDGHCIPIYQDHYRSQVVCRELEQDFGLERVPSTGEVERRSPSRRQRQKEEETGVAPVLTKLQAAISEVALQHRGADWEEFVQALAKQGVEVRTKERLVSQKPTICVSYAMNDVAISGSKLGNRFTVAGLREGFGVGKQPEERDVFSTPNPSRETLLIFVRKRLEATKDTQHKGKSIKTKDGLYLVERDECDRITITRLTSDGEKGEIILNATRNQLNRWDVTIDQMEPEDEQNFDRYQAHRQQRQQQSKQKEPKQKQQEL